MEKSFLIVKRVVGCSIPDIGAFTAIVSFSRRGSIRCNLNFWILSSRSGADVVERDDRGSRFPVRQRLDRALSFAVLISAF